MRGHDARNRPDKPLQLSNEFAFVEISVVQTGNGERLRVASPSRGRYVLMDPVVLEALTSFSPEELTRFVEMSLDPRPPHAPMDVA